jgi:trk system potassium uptake protein TrkH
MFIGASPGSTGGGVKTTTVATLWAAITAHLRRREHVQLLNRTLSTETVLKAGYVVILSLVVTTITVLMVTLTNKQDPLNIIFESVSAFGTVGLSRGITPLLDDSGKLWLSLLMFIGRVGVLSLAYSLANTRKPAQYEYAQERVMIG